MTGARARLRPVLQAVSWVGLGISGLTLVFALPRMFEHGGGAGRVLGNAAVCGWTLLLLALAVAPVRTIGPRALAGAWFSGFFGVISLATLIGRPVIKHFGLDSSFAIAFWAPLTEELLKLLPVALFLVLATRSRRARPSVGDAALFAAAVGGGFAVYENALYARGAGGWGAHPPFSLLLPSLQQTAADGTTILVGGHLVFTTVAGLGLAIALTYRRRFRFAWLAAPITFVVVLTEHAMANEMSLTSAGIPAPAWLGITRILTLDGYLSTILLLAATAVIAIVEPRLVSGTGLVPVAPPGARLTGYLQSLRPPRGLISGRAAALALAQCGPVPEGVQS